MSPAPAFSSFDPLLLLPVPPRAGLLVGPDPGHDILAQAYGSFERTLDLRAPGPAPDAIVALEWPASIADLVEQASARLAPGGTLLARLANRQLPGVLARRLYPGLERGVRQGSSLGEIRRAVARGFAEQALYCWWPTETFPYVTFPVHERRMQRFYLEQLMPTWGLKGRLFSRLGGLVPPAWLTSHFLVVARKGN